MKRIWNAWLQVKEVFGYTILWLIAVLIALIVLAVVVGSREDQQERELREYLCDDQFEDLYDCLRAAKLGLAP